MLTSCTKLIPVLQVMEEKAQVELINEQSASFHGLKDGVELQGELEGDRRGAGGAASQVEAEPSELTRLVKQSRRSTLELTPNLTLKLLLVNRALSS